MVKTKLDIDHRLILNNPERTLKGLMFSKMAGAIGLKSILKAILQAVDGRLAGDAGQTLDKVPKSIRRQLLFILGIRGFLHNNKLFTSSAKKLSGLMFDHLENSETRAVTLPVSQVYFDDIHWETFFDQYIRNAQPVVIKNFPFNAHKEWSLNWFLQHCANSKVIFTNMETGHNFVGPLSELKDREKSLYVHNSEQLLLQNPDLIKDLNLDLLESLSKWRFTFAQVFLGNNIGTGTSYHCARSANFFYMIKGRKRWTFVDPRNTLLLYPYLTPGNAYQDSLVSGLNDDKDFERFPLYRQCPRLQVVLEPGDVLFNPSWWWHSVQNITEETIGVSSRWSYVCKVNNLFDALMELTPERHHDRRMAIETLLSKSWDTRGQVRLSQYTQDNFEPSMFEANSHSEEVASAKKSGLAQRSWF